MKRASAALLALALTWSASVPLARGATHGSETIRVGGKDYARLTDWARANDLEAHWLKRDESLVLSNRVCRLLLQADSREVDANGISVFLVLPLVRRDGALYASQLDLQSTLRPLIAPSRNRSGSPVKTICLDPGHGGTDPGNHAGANQEKKYTLLLAQEVRDQLVRAGFKVSLTRTTDTFIALPSRPDIARRRNADLFISLHFNSTENSRNEIHGAEVYCMTPVGASSTNAQGEGSGAGSYPGNRQNDQNLLLAYQMQKALTRDLGVEDRGVRRARFAVLRGAAMPAVLIEAGFMSHPAEGKKIFDAKYRRQMAKAIVEGVTGYKHEVERGG